MCIKNDNKQKYRKGREKTAKECTFVNICCSPFFAFFAIFHIILQEKGSVYHPCFHMYNIHAHTAETLLIYIFHDVYYKYMIF